MENIILKLEKKFPNSEIRIRKNKIFIYNSTTGIEEYFGEFSENFREIELQKSPLFKSQSWANVFNPGIAGFSGFGRREKKDNSKGLEILAKYFIRRAKTESAKRAGKFDQKNSENRMRKRREITKQRNIEDTGNSRGEIGGSSKKRRLLEILRNMKLEKEKIIILE